MSISTYSTDTIKDIAKTGNGGPASFDVLEDIAKAVNKKTFCYF